MKVPGKAPRFVLLCPRHRQPVTGRLGRRCPECESDIPRSRQLLLAVDPASLAYTRRPRQGWPTRRAIRRREKEARRAARAATN